MIQIAFGVYSSQTDAKTMDSEESDNAGIYTSLIFGGDSHQERT